MIERKRRKKNKVRGERTHGKGNTKNSRGGGCRGGRGRAGAYKGKFASIGRLDKKKFRLKPKEKGKIITLGELNDKIEKFFENKKVKKENDLYIIDQKSGFEKILSQGKIEKKLLVKISASKKAVQKIVEAGGEVEEKQEKKKQVKNKVENEEEK